MVLAAIDKGFSVLGFSGHGYTEFDHRYCMTDTEGYIKEILALKEKYKGKIEILLGIEEEMRHKVERDRYDYIIGSSHYSYPGGEMLDVDGSKESTQKCIEAWGDPLRYAEDYYRNFCEYILERRPDIIGHFDLLTKYDDVLGDGGVSAAAGYRDIANKYARIAAKADCLFEINTGAISRGYRKDPYPSADILYTLKNEGARIMLNSDCHEKSALTCHFAESRAILKDIGFRELYHFRGGEVIKEYI